MLSRFAQDKKRQIDTLKIFNDNVIEIIENEEYSLGFQSGGHQFTLNVYLGNNFPNEKPRFIINPCINHHWINLNNGEIENAPGLLNFTIHSDLGRVAQAIIREIEKHPPTPQQFLNNVNIQSGTVSTSAAPQPTTSTVSMSADFGGACSGAAAIQINEENLEFPSLLTLNIDELKNLNNDIDYLDEFIENLEPIQLLNAKLDVLINEVKQIAETNLLKKDVIQTKKEFIGNNIVFFKELGEKYAALNKRYQRKSEEFAPQHIKELLQIATSIADSECDNCVQQFLSGQIQVQQFLNKYLEAKRISAIRKAKEERLTQQLNAFDKATF